MKRGEWCATVDYLRVTCPETVGGEVLHQLSAAYSMAGDAFPLEEEKKDARRIGFYGRSLGPAFLGYRDAYQMLQVSGGEAHSAALALGEWAYSVPRLDLAVTVCQGEGHDDTAARAAAAAAAARDANPLARKRKVAYIDGKGNGDTCYIGARTSETFGRVYDKGRESGEEAWAYCWRWEVEYHNEAAEAVYKDICHSGFDVKIIAGHVKDWYERRGVKLPVCVSADPVGVTTLPREKSSTDKTLEWLSKSVQPCVRRLLRTVDRDTLLHVLGLHDSPGRDANLYVLSESEGNS